MRALTARQATNCENAKSPRCRCRCGGVLHGKERFGSLEESALLPETDAHHAAPPKPRTNIPPITGSGGVVSRKPGMSVNGTRP